MLRFAGHASSPCLELLHFALTRLILRCRWGLLVINHLLARTWLLGSSSSLCLLRRNLLFLIWHDVLSKDSLLSLLSLEFECRQGAHLLFIEFAGGRLIVLTGADAVRSIFARVMVHAHVHRVGAFDVFLHLRAVLLRLILQKKLHSLLLLVDLVSSFCIYIGNSSHLNAIILLVCILESVLVKIDGRRPESLGSRMVWRTYDPTWGIIGWLKLVRQAFPPTSYLLSSEQLVDCPAIVRRAQLKLLQMMWLR